MTIWIRKFSSFDEEAEADVEFYRQMTPEERVALVEQLRAEWIATHHEGDERLRRTVTRVRAE